MAKILRLSLTLSAVGILSALLLTAMFNLTDPIITERQEQEYRQALEQFFPDFEKFETERFDNDYFDLIFDRGGKLIGIMSTIQQQGYDGAITYNMALDADGKILGILIVSHTETPGIGDVITTESFKEQFIGKSFADPITAGEDVDIISGATISTAAVINSVRRVTGVVAANYLGQGEPEIDISAVADGTYLGSAPGLMGPITVEVVVSDGKIVSIDVLEHEETPTYFIESYPAIPELIIDGQSLDVDIKTGATVSAEGIVNAVRDALMRTPAEGRGE